MIINYIMSFGRKTSFQQQRWHRDIENNSVSVISSGHFYSFTKLLFVTCWRKGIEVTNNQAILQTWEQATNCSIRVSSIFFLIWVFFFLLWYRVVIMINKTIERKQKQHFMNCIHLKRFYGLLLLKQSAHSCFSHRRIYY